MKFTNTLRFLACIFAFSLFALQVKAQVSAAKMEAVYIYNFTKYINWTSNADKFIIGVIGNPEMEQELQKSLAGKKVGVKDIEIKSITSAQAATCQIVYLGSNSSADLAGVIGKLKGKGILLVCQDDLADKGACISFFMQGGKLKFKLNQAALKESGLKTSDNLLAFATVIAG